MHALIASGSGRYGDPWHPFRHTSPLLAEVLTGAGFTVDVDDDVDHALANLDLVDLLVVNAGDPWRGDEAAIHAPADSVAGFDRALDRGVGLLGVHASVSSLRDYPRWAESIGAIWIPGVSSHPPVSRTDIRIDATFNGIDDFEVVDERYGDLQLVGRSRVIARHDRDGESLSTAWIRDGGAARVACDLLGHDERSYDSAGHRTLIAWLALWAVGQLRPGVESRSTG